MTQQTDNFSIAAVGMAENIQSLFEALWQLVNILSPHLAPAAQEELQALLDNVEREQEATLLSMKRAASEGPTVQ